MVKMKMWQEIVTSIPFIFLVSVLVASILFWVGGVVKAKGKKSLQKLTAYACGEDLPPIKPQIHVKRFFIYGLYFLIFDALAFLLALSFHQPGVYPVIFAVIALITILVLVPVRWH